MSQSDLLRLLEATRPDLSPAEMVALIAATPDAPARATRKPVQARRGSRPRTAASMERRRSWASSGRMPPKLQCRFTIGEAAVMAVIAVEVAKTGACTLCLDAIAALAGVGRSTTKRALRQAQELHLIKVEVRRQSAWRNYTNIITITDLSWLSWLRMGRRGGVHFGTGTNTKTQERRFRPQNPGPDPRERAAPVSDNAVYRTRSGPS